MATATPKKPAPVRLYFVEAKDGGKPEALIEATNASQAARHLVEKRFTVRYAEQADVFAAAKAGVEVEKATASDDAE